MNITNKLAVEAAHTIVTLERIKSAIEGAVNGVDFVTLTLTKEQAAMIYVLVDRELR